MTKKGEEQNESEDGEYVDDVKSESAASSRSISPGLSSQHRSTMPSLDKIAMIRKRKRQKDRKYDDDLSDLEQETGDFDTSERITEKGGYAHTIKSKMRISRANKGNTPWNKGGNRSAADKAKISAGVRARNRALLLEKLKKLGMSEEEWFEKKKQIKYLRERVRKARVKKDQKLIKEEEEQLQTLLDNAEKPGTTQPLPARQTKVKKSSVKKAAKQSKTTKRASKKVKVEATSEKVVQDETIGKMPEADETVGKMPEANESVGKMPEAKGTTNEGKRDNKPLNDNPQPSKTLAPATVPLPTALFSKDIEWTPHPFDKSFKNGAKYGSKCPNGGPGGLICCTGCTKQYSAFLSATTTDIEKQKTQKVNNEVMQLLGFLSGAKAQLGSALQLARSRTGTGPMHKVIKSKAKPTSGKRSAPSKTVTKNATPKEPPLNETSALPALMSGQKSATTNSELTVADADILSKDFVAVSPHLNGHSQETLSYELPYEPGDHSLAMDSTGGDEGGPDHGAIETVAV